MPPGLVPAKSVTANGTIKLGDVNVAEPGALVGFAGPRVIEQTVRETLPEGFQRSEFLLEHGAIDFICDRREMRERLSRVIAMLTGLPSRQQHIVDSDNPTAEEIAPGTDDDLPPPVPTDTD